MQIDYQNIIQWGCYLKSSDGELSLPKIKRTSHNWNDANGLDVDLSSSYVEPRGISIELTMICSDANDYIAKINSLFAQLQQSGLHVLKFDYIARPYFVYLDDTITPKRLTPYGSNQLAATITLKFIEPYPVGRYFVTNIVADAVVLSMTASEQMTMIWGDGQSETDTMFDSIHWYGGTHVYFAMLAGDITKINSLTFDGLTELTGASLPTETPVPPKAITLNTPVPGIIDVISQTELTAHVSGVDSRCLFLRFEYKKAVDSVWITYFTQLPKTTTQIALTGLTTATLYDFRWSAIGDGNLILNSAYSAVSQGATAGLTKLNMIQGVVSVSNSPTQNGIAWTDTNNSPNETYYRIRRAINPDFSDVVTLTSTLTANYTQYIDTTATGGIYYYYGITCIGNGSTTTNSDEYIAGCQTLASWKGQMIASYRNRNSHIPENYFNSKIVPFLETELDKQHYINTYSTRTVADWFFAIEMVGDGKIVETAWNIVQGYTNTLRWSINNTFYDTNHFGGSGTTPPAPVAAGTMILISDIGSFNSFNRICFENVAGMGIRANDNCFGGYMPWHEFRGLSDDRTLIAGLYIGYCYFTGSMPAYNFASCFHLCTNFTPFTGVFKFTCPTVKELYISNMLVTGWDSANEYPQLEYINMNVCPNTTGPKPLVGKVMPNLFQYIIDNTGFTGSINNLDSDQITTINMYNVGAIGDLNIDLSKCDRFAFDNCGITSVTRLLVKYPLTYFRFRNMAMPQAAVDKLVDIMFNNGSFAHISYYLNGGTNATPSTAAQAKITAMRNAGATVYCNGF
jgi:hypothetical protein